MSKDCIRVSNQQLQQCKQEREGVQRISIGQEVANLINSSKVPTKRQVHYESQKVKLEMLPSDQVRKKLLIRLTTTTAVATHHSG